MSIRTLLIWIIIAGLLGAAALFARSQKLQAAREHTPTAITIGLDPAAVVSLTRSVGDQREVLERDPKAIDRWMIRWERGDQTHAWEADPAKARSGLRALATTRVVKSEQDLIRTPAGRVTVRSNNGAQTTIDFGSTSTGGLTPVRVEVRGSDGVATGRWFGRIERSVADAFVGASLRQWRSERLFDLAASAVRGVELDSGPYATALTRTGTGWMIESPVSIHAETETVESMVKSLLATTAASFIDEPLDEEATGLSKPLAVITLATSSDRVTLRVGTRADVEGNLVYARVERGEDMTLVRLATKSLGKLTAVPDAYVAQTPSAAGTTQVGGVRVLGRDDSVKLDAVRSASGWTINDTAADSLNRGAIDRLLGLLMSQPASGVRIMDDDPGLNQIAWVELVGRDTTVLDRFAVALDQGEGGMRVLFIRDLGEGRYVVWAQSGDHAAATGAWLTAVASRRVPSN